MFNKTVFQKIQSQLLNLIRMTPQWNTLHRVLALFHDQLVFFQI